MSLSAQRVNEGVRLTARAQQVLQKILELTERSTADVLEIAKATRSMRAEAPPPQQAIEQVTKMVQQNRCSTQQQSLTSAQSLRAGLRLCATRHCI